MTVIIAKNERTAQSMARNLGGVYFPDFDGTPFSENSPYVRAQRTYVLYRLLENDVDIIVCTLTSLSRFTIPPDIFTENTHRFHLGEDFYLLPEKLYTLGYERVDQVKEVGEFSFRGEVIDLYTPLYKLPIRLELFDRKIEDIRLFDPYTQRSVERMENFEIIPVREYLDAKHDYDTIPKLAGSDSTLFEFLKNPEFFSPDFDTALKEHNKKLRELKELAGENWEEYYQNSLLPFDYVLQKIGDVKKIEIEEKKIVVLEEPEKIEALPLVDVDDLSVGDIVVHKDYGIGKFEGVERIKSPLGEKDFLKIKYADSTLFVPVDRINRVHKYLGAKDVQLDTLKSTRWKNRVKRAKKDIERRVKELVKLYAKRALVKGLSLPGEPELEKAFADSFPYIETSDQMKAIEDVLEDLASDKPMDRLVSGDSGFGKTEVALRAAMRTVASGKQVALMAPTVVLANQHYRTFKERFEPFGVKVELLDSTKKGKKRQKIIEMLKKGEIDVIVGTHSLLSSDVKFADLGLLIIDEEQKFGVEQKEKLKKYRVSVNVLSMSATPIPRTLHMALSGMKDISTINTPPIGRKPVTVYVEPFSERVVKNAVLRELTRGGQVIYVHNRVEELPKVYDMLKKLLPEVSIAVAHGRMNKKRLEEIMESFERGEIELLLCTTVIESGIDIGTANTIIVDDSHRYGLSQLYQLRGRVGRRRVRGYAYFLYPKDISKDALKRLEIIKTHTGAGSGLEIALRDLEMRGYGDLLGIEQSGHIESIGYRYYVEILKETISKYKGEEFVDIDVEISGYPGDVVLPEDYISDPMERMRLYRKIASATDFTSLEDVAEELKDRFGKLPEPVINLINLARLRIMLYKIGVKKAVFSHDNVVLFFKKDINFSPFENLKYIINERKNSIVVMASYHLFYKKLLEFFKTKVSH